MDDNQELDLDQKIEINSVEQLQDTSGQVAQDSLNNIRSDENIIIEPVEENVETVSQLYNYSQSQFQWMDRQISNLERELLLNNNKAENVNFMSNWTKVILSALAVIIPGIGQIMGIILGLVFVSDDNNADKRTYGVALITVSVVVFIISAVFWFIFALIFGPQIYY